MDEKRLKEQKGQQLKEMVLEHVPQYSSTIVIASASPHRHFLCDRDLYVVDKIAIPDRFKDAVREAQHEQVLNRFLTEVVIDSVDLLLGEDAVQRLVEVVCGVVVVAEGLFDDDPRPAQSALVLVVESGRAHLLDYFAVDLRGHRTVVATVATGAAFGVERFQTGFECGVGGRVGRVAADVVEPGEEGVERALIDLADEFGDPLAHLLAEIVIVPIAAGDANQGEGRRQAVLFL